MNEWMNRETYLKLLFTFPLTILSTNLFAILFWDKRFAAVPSLQMFNFTICVFRINWTQLNGIQKTDCICTRHYCYTVKPVLSGHPRDRECCSVRLIQGVRLKQVSIDNVIWGVKCHSNEQWQRLEYSQRLWRYTFALISLFKWTNWSKYHKHRLQLKFEEIRWVNQALSLHKQNEIENMTVLWN